MVTEWKTNDRIAREVQTSHGKLAGKQWATKRLNGSSIRISYSALLSLVPLVHGSIYARAKALNTYYYVKNFPLVRLPNVILTPHIGIQTEEGTERIGKKVLQIAGRYL